MKAKIPQITDFRLPVTVYRSGILIALLLYTTFAPSVSPSDAQYQLWMPANFLRDLVGPTALKAIWGLMLSVHALEGAFTFRLARKHSMPFGTAVRAFASFSPG